VGRRPPEAARSARPRPGQTTPLRLPPAEPLVAAVAEPTLLRRVEAALAADGLTVVAAVSTAEDLAEACAARVPHVTTLDWKGSGAAALRVIAATMPQTRVVVLLRAGDARVVREALRAGADGVVAVSDVALLLGTVVRSVALGQASVPRERRMSLARFALSPRERDVVALASRGMRPATIAEQLSLAPSTVKRYLSSVYAKVGVSSREELRDVVIDDLEHDAPNGPAGNGEP